MILIRIRPLLIEIENGQHKELEIIELELDDTTDIIAFDPRLIIDRYPEFKNELYGCHCYISCNAKPIMIIKDFTYFMLQPFRDKSATIDHLKIYNIKEFFHLGIINIRRIDIENSSSIIFDCKIKELYAGIESVDYKLKGDETSPDKKHYLDIRKSNIIEFKNFTQKEKIVLDNSHLEYVDFFNGSEIVEIINNTYINNLFLRDKINQISINDSRIEILKGSRTFLINTFKDNYSSIERIYDIFEANIITNNESKFQLLQNSYKNSKNYDYYAKYSYLLKKHELSKQEGFIKKIPYWILKVSCGFGYKPASSLLFSISIIFIFSFIYFLFTLIGYPNWGLNVCSVDSIIKLYLNSFYYSIVTFTTLGYGDLACKDLICKICSGFEALSGIYSMSIIVYSFTKRNIEM